MRINYHKRGKTWLLAGIFLLVGGLDAGAVELWGDKFTVTGFLRQELAVHVGPMNPNNAAVQENNNRLNLSRTMFQTEWKYEPNDVFQLFSKIRLIHDQTDMLDDDLTDYNAFPLSTPRYGTYLRPTDDDNINLEMSELYADVTLGSLWIRVGKQQIVWGEMIGARIMDIINPLDYSWHFQFEPEEFENIRLPQWAIRAVYNVSDSPLPGVQDIYLEGFFNPGDISPSIYPSTGAPWKLFPDTPPFFVKTEKDRWGDKEFGFRVGGRIGQMFATLNYFYLYNDSGIWDFTGWDAPGPPSPINNYYYDIIYPQIDVYGMSMNYAFDQPINTTLSFEGTYIPDYPYYDRFSITGIIREKSQWKWSLLLARKTFVFPTPISAMDLKLQITQAIVEDADDLKSTPSTYDPQSNKIDSTSEIIAFYATQYFWYNQIKVDAKVLYDVEGAYYMMPYLRYSHGNDWYFDLYGVILGGSEKRAGTFGSLSWGDEVVARVTCQF